MLCASRFGQSPFSCSFHFIMFALPLATPPMGRQE
jgi:hypothetical protein